MEETNMKTISLAIVGDIIALVLIFSNIPMYEAVVAVDHQPEDS